MHPCIISQINPTRCTILLSTFIYSSSLHVSGIHVSFMRRKLLYPCVTGTCHYAWVASGVLVGFSAQPAYETPPIQCDKYQWCMGTVIFSCWWAHWCPKHVEKINKYIEQNCIPSWIYLWDQDTGRTVQFCNRDIRFFVLSKTPRAALEPTIHLFGG